MSQRRILASLLLIAAALRVAATGNPSVHHPDEVFQYLEQAHRLVFGYGYIPWEYRDGMRSWLVPALLAGAMRIGAALGGEGWLLLPRLAVALATTAIVWGAWRIGARTSRVHALLAGLVATVWYDQVYFAAHTLTETIATAAAVPAAALLAGPHAAPRGEAPAPRGNVLLVVAGALLAFAAVVRPHYAPALALLAAWRCRLDIRGWAWLVAGSAGIAGAAALIDLVAGMTPFAWIVASYHRNVIDGAQATYGLSGPGYYLVELARWWGAAFMPIVFLAILGARRQPQLLVAALATIALHSAIGHKELRFVLLAMTLLVILAALGTADLVTMARRRRAALVAAAAAWCLASLAGAATGAMRWRWSEGSPALAATRAAAAAPGLCGLATYDLRYWQTGGYAYLHRRVPIYPLTARDELGTPPMDARAAARIAAGFDTLLTPPAGERAVPRSFRRIACFVPTAPFASAADRAARSVCLYRRGGGCDPGIAAPWRLR